MNLAWLLVLLLPLLFKYFAANAFHVLQEKLAFLYLFPSLDNYAKKHKDQN
jgi:hypothetical protein